MTGRALATDAVPLTQAVNCVVVATAADLAARGREMPCIRCGDCATVCPPGLLPQSLLRAITAGDDDQVARHGLADCIECGCCDYVARAGSRSPPDSVPRARHDGCGSTSVSARPRPARDSHVTKSVSRQPPKPTGRPSRRPEAGPVASGRADSMAMRFETSPAPHVIAGFSVPRVMFQVLLALLPVGLVQVAVFGPGLLLQMLVAGPVALACEALALRARGRDAAPFLRDGSVLVTAALLAVAVPPLLPWWLMALGTAIAVLLGKHVFGGLGSNPFNPAMVGYAALLVSFPLEMTRWPVPFAPGGDWDAYTGATALDALRTGLGQRLTMEEIFAGPAFGSSGGQGAQWINLAALAGGLYLLVRGLVRWHIPVAVLAGITLPAFAMHAIDPGAYASATFQLFSGATMLGAFFIATDPVSAATSDRGRLVYGAGIGAITWAIRTWGGYPDGIAFARAADERRGAAHRPLHDTEDPWTRPALNLSGAGHCVRRCCSRQPPSSRWASSRS